MWSNSDEGPSVNMRESGENLERRSPVRVLRRNWSYINKRRQRRTSLCQQVVEPQSNCQSLQDGMEARLTPRILDHQSKDARVSLKQWGE